MDAELIHTIESQQKLEILRDKHDQLLRISFSLEKCLEQKEVTVVTGVRRSGKSTLTQQLVRTVQSSWNIHYLNFEDQKLRHFVLDDFETAFNRFLLRADQTKNHLLIYDEIQLVDGWERWVASFTSQVSPLYSKSKVIITGSNAKLLSTELSTLLTGRHNKELITPLTFKETLKKEYQSLNSEDLINEEDIIAIKQSYLDYKSFGGFPRAYTTRSTKILSQYYEDIILKDIAVRKKVRNIGALQSLGTILASQNTRLLNKSRVAAELGIKDTNTLTKFCGYFIESYLYSELKAYSPSKRKQLRSLSKFYCVDPIMALENGYHATNSDYWILENLVYNHLKSQYKEIWYWHSKERYEIDFLAKAKTGELHAYQVSQSIKETGTKERECRAIIAAIDELKITKAFIITEFETETIVMANSEIKALPYYKWVTDQLKI